MNTIKSFLSWIKLRWLRLAIGVLIITVGIQEHDYFIGFIGTVLFVQGVLNQSCCGNAGCIVPEKKR